MALRILAANWAVLSFFSLYFGPVPGHLFGIREGGVAHYSLAYWPFVVLLTAYEPLLVIWSSLAHTHYVPDSL